MSELAIIGEIEVAPENRDRLLAALKAHKARRLKDEPGTLQFEVLQPRDEDARVLAYEVYQDDAAFDVHRNNPSLARFREDTAGIITAFRATRCAQVM